MLFGRSLEKDVGPSIDEKRDIGGLDGLPSAADTVGLIDCLAEFSIRWKTVFQVAAYSARIDCETNRLADNSRRVAIAAFQVDRHGEVRRADNPPQIVDGQVARDPLAIRETVCVGDGPTTRRDRLRSIRGDSLGAARIPDVEKH